MKEGMKFDHTFRLENAWLKVDKYTENHMVRGKKKCGVSMLEDKF